MTGAEALANVLEFMGPLGAFLDPDARECAEATWVNTGGFELVPPGLGLLVNRPTADELQRAEPRDFEFGLSLILAMIRESDANAQLTRIVPLLQNPLARSAIVAVIGSLGLESGLAALASLLEGPALSEEEAIGLACSLGEVAAEHTSTNATVYVNGPDLDTDPCRYSSNAI